MDLSPVMILGCVWVVLSAVVAMLPMRWQYAPGLVLLLAAPFLLLFIAVEHGWFWAAIGAIGFVSMFRKPLKFLAGKAMRAFGRAPQEGEQ